MKNELTPSPAQPAYATEVVDANEAPRVATPQSRRRRVQQLSDEIGRLVSSLMGCVVIGWSCFNLVKNANELWNSGASAGSLVPALGMIVLFCLVPFALGVFLLARKTGQSGK